MVTSNRGSEEVGPVQDHSSVSLFLKSFELSEDASEPYDFDTRLGSVQDSLKSMVSRSPNKLRELARNIVNETSKSSKASNDRVSMEKSTEVLPATAAVAEVNPRERRPGLGSKRARFFIKPDSRQNVVNIEPMLDVKNLSDPEEFFKVYERHENAKKEIQRQLGGVLSDSEAQNTSLTGRPRRPGLPGRNKRKAVYKHLYPSDDLETNNNVVSSQEQIDSSILTNEYHGSEEESDHGLAPQATELTAVKAWSSTNKILDELLSCNPEELEGEQAQSVIQKRLQMKPIELQKLNLPDFPKMNLNYAPSQKLRFSNITRYLNHGSESSIHSVASPTPPKSPFASFSTVSRRISPSSPSNDPFSAQDIGLEPTTSPSIVQLNKEFTETARQFTTESPLPEGNKNIELPSTGTTKQDGALDVGLSASHIPGNVDTDISTDDGFVNDDLVVHDVDGSTQANGTNVQDESIELPRTGMTKQDGALDVGLSASNLPNIDGNTQANETDVQNEIQETNNGLVNDELVTHDVDGSSQANEANVQDEVEIEVQETDVTAQPCLDTADVTLNNGPEEHIEINQEKHNAPLEKKLKAKSQSRKAQRRRTAERRKSLAGAGTTWNGGVRRSTRIKSRPLEHWKGERLLYGRIHKSLPTVIGIKYSSPGKSGETSVLKVKSFVGAEYDDLVQLAALH